MKEITIMYGQTETSPVNHMTDSGIEGCAVTLNLQRQFNYSSAERWEGCGVSIPLSRDQDRR